MRVTKAEFLVGAASLRQLPKGGLPEIALAGRSNVWKSSLLNRLAGRKSLARISKTPGKTRELNAYCLNDALVVVDLPGYGFAKVPEALKRKWGVLVESYLGEREELAGIVHLVDARHPPSRDDVAMHEWIRHYRVPALIAATKADKLPRSRGARSLEIIHEALGPEDETPLLLFSAVTGDGVDALLSWMWRIGKRRNP